MNWLDDLRTQFPGIAICAATPRTGANANRHPRDVLADTLANSIALLSNPAHTVTVRGEQRKPTACYTIDNGVATVALSYSRQRLVLDAVANATEIKVDVVRLAALLAKLQGVVASGVFDAQLADIKAVRVSAQRAGLAVAGGAFDAQLAAINDQRMADLKKIIAAKKQAA